MIRSGANCLLQIDFIGCTIACPFAQAAQRQFHRAAAQVGPVIKLTKFPAITYFHRPLVAAFALADAHALGVIAIGAKGAGARSAYPF